MLEKTLESPLDCKEVKPVNPKGSQSWIVIGRADAEVPVLSPPDLKSQLTGKDPDAGKDWGQKEKEASEDEMVAWHHRLNGHEFEQTAGDGEGQTCHAAVHGVAKSWTWLSNWTTTNKVEVNMLLVRDRVSSKYIEKSAFIQTSYQAQISSNIHPQAKECRAASHDLPLCPDPLRLASFLSWLYKQPKQIPQSPSSKHCHFLLLWTMHINFTFTGIFKWTGRWH